MNLPDDEAEYETGEQALNAAIRKHPWMDFYLVSVDETHAVVRNDPQFKRTRSGSIIRPMPQRSNFISLLGPRVCQSKVRIHARSVLTVFCRMSNSLIAIPLKHFKVLCAYGIDQIEKQRGSLSEPDQRFLSDFVVF